MRHANHLLVALSLALALSFLAGPITMEPSNGSASPRLGADRTARADTNYYLNLPLVANPFGSPSGSTPRVNVPYFNGDIRFAETAIFWFGRITPTENYVDVRTGYNNSELYVRLAVFDRRMWYDPTPSAGDLTAFDGATLYLAVNNNPASVPGSGHYRLDSQLNDEQTPHTPWQAAYRGNGSGWSPAQVPFTVSNTYAWESDTEGGINNNANNRAWAMTFHIPFASLGLSGPPAQGTLWKLAVAVHDRDDSAGTVIADKVWPRGLAPTSPTTWGQLGFGLRTYTPPQATRGGSVTIRNKLNGAVVTDGGVGGYTTCGDGLDYWSQWGEKVYDTYYDQQTGQYQKYGDFNIQNQSKIADWPCFSKYYVTFPLNTIPTGQAILSATLTLHEFGGSGDPGQAGPSLIQVMTVDDNWDKASLSWNSAPLAHENISQAWVSPVTNFPGWPGVPYTWDVSLAAAQAYAAGKPLRLVLYTADDAFHSGKYFISSDTGDWNAAGRPALNVTWGTAVSTSR